MAFTALIGQPRVQRLLDALVHSGRFPSLLFTGQPGVGKRTAALLLAQAANCESASDRSRAQAKSATRPCGACRSCQAIAALKHPDVVVLFPLKPRRTDTDPDPEEMAQELYQSLPGYALTRAQPTPEPTHTIGIGLIRWVRNIIAKPPGQGHHRLFIILHAQRMTRDAANAFLKTLEEPYERTSFVLTTDNPAQLLPTIRSRCQTVRFANIPEELIRSWLSEHAGADSTLASMAAAIAHGSLGRALQFLRAPEELVNPDALDFFARAEVNERVILEVLARIGDKAELSTIVETLLFLYDRALHEKLAKESSTQVVQDSRGTGHNYADRAKEKAAALSLRDLIRATTLLRSRLDDSRLNIYQPLALYTLLSALRQRRTKSG